MPRATVVIELAGDAQFARDLAVGGVFVPECTLRLTEECDLVVRGAYHEIVVAARVVYVDAHQGAGLELIGFSSELKARLAELAPVGAPGLEFLDDPVLHESMADGPAIDDPVVPDDDSGRGEPNEPILLDLQALEEAGDTYVSLPVSTGDSYVSMPVATGDTHVSMPVSAGDDGDGANVDDEATLAAAGAAAADAYYGDAHADVWNTDTLPAERVAEHVAAAGASAGDPREAGSATASPSRAMHERLRGLTLAAQVKLAGSGELHERIVLERLYGKNVWETLLGNPRLTTPEISRIARYATLPRVLLEIIVGNNAWLQIPEVRRALLSNPRLASDQIMKVLRLTPKHELKIAAIQTAYPYAVRSAAKLILRDE